MSEHSPESSDYARSSDAESLPKSGAIRGPLYRFFASLLNFLLKMVLFFWPNSWRGRVRRLVAAIFIVFVAWGGEWYLKYIKQVPELEMLPDRPEFILRANINPNSGQYTLLERHLEKFPGYSILRKNLDPVGEGETISQFFQDSLKTFDIDFSAEMKPILGDSAYIAIPSLKPISDGIRKTSLSFFGNLTSGSLFASQSIPGSSEVLGDSVSKGEGGGLLDFIVVARVTDVLQAAKMFREVAKREDTFITEKSYRGFSYYRVNLDKEKKRPLPDNVPEILRFRDLYQAIVGGNWVCASSEGDIQALLDRQSQRISFRSVTGLSSRRDESSIAERFRKVNEQFGDPDPKEVLSMMLFDIDSAEVLNSSCESGECDFSSEYFRYPERMSFGTLFSANEDGFEVKWAQDADGMKETRIVPENSTFASVFPEQVGGQWTDIFAENNSAKESFYDFKRVRLTDRGRFEYGRLRDLIRQTANIDIEGDVIDNLSGSVAFALLAGDGDPAAVILAKTHDSSATISLMSKVAALARRLIEERETEIRSNASPMACKERSESESLGARKRCLDAEEDRVALEREELEVLEAMKQNARLVSKETPVGTVYSFSLSETFPYSLLSFSFLSSGETFVLGPRASVVQSVSSALKNTSAGALKDNALYRAVSHSDFGRESGTRLFVVPEGILGVVRHFSDDLLSSAHDMDPSSSTGESMGNLGFANAFLRTIRAFGSISSVKGNFVVSRSRVLIEAVSDKEKQEAERSLRNSLSNFQEN